MKAGLWLAQRGSACLRCEGVLAAILSSQLRAGPQGEQVVSRAWAAQRYQMTSGGGLISSSAVKNTLGNTCCQSTFAVRPLPGPQKSPKEPGAFDRCLLDLLPFLFPAWPSPPSSHAPSASSLLALRQDLPRVPSQSRQLWVPQGERSRLRNQEVTWLVGRAGWGCQQPHLQELWAQQAAWGPLRTLSHHLSLTCQSSSFPS